MLLELTDPSSMAVVHMYLSGIEAEDAELHYVMDQVNRSIT